MRIALALVALVAAAPAFAGITPTRLRCEYKTNPLAVDSPKPRLFWIVESGERDQKQTAYQVLVASSPELLEKNVGDLWDTGKIASDETTQLIYGGKSLSASQAAYWKVRVWDKSGKVSRWSTVAQWTQGLAPSDWTAQWIGGPSLPKPPPAPPLDGAQWIWWSGDPASAPKTTRVFRHVFTAQSLPQSALLCIAADDSYKVRLNGKEVPSGPTEGWRSYQVLDLKKFVVAGQNLLTIDVENGEPGPAGLIAKLVLDGVAQTTGSAWEAAAQASGPWTAAKIVAEYGGAPWGKIGASGASNNAMTPPPHFRKSFTVEKKIKRALLYATALGVYELSLNGKPISDDVLSPGWTEYKKRVHYLAYDVTKQLQSGPNTLGAILGDGWYASYLAFTGRRHYYGGDPRLRLQLQVEYTDGTKETIGTGAGWETATGPIVYSDMLMGVSTDTRKELSNWQPASIAEDPKILVQAHPGEPIRPSAQKKALARTEPKPGVFIYNIGQNLSGWVRLKVSGKPGQVITVRHGERLNPDGTLYTTNLRAAKATDTYVLKGGTQILEPKFTFHGFQYVEITGCDKAPALGDVVAVAVHSQMGQTLSLTTSSPLVNQLVSNIDWGFRSNALDVPTDCPQRDERAGWTGDAQVFAKTAMLGHDSAAFFTKWLDDLIEDGQGEDGALPDVAPYLNMVGRGNAAWEDSGVVVTYRMYEMFGDKTAILAHWPALTRYMEHLTKVAPTGIRDVGAYGDWLLLDSPQKSSLHGTAYYYYCASLMATMAEATGKTAEAARYKALAETVKAAFNAKYVTAEGRVEDAGQSSQTFYALALAWDLLPIEKRPTARRELERQIRLRGGHLATGFIGTPVVLFALDNMGRADLANELVLNETFPSWLYQVKLGATSMWERWDGWTPEKGFQDPGMNSFNHYWLGCVEEWLTTGLVGIDTDGPGWKKITIRPRIAEGLSHANATYDSIRGKISSGWLRNPDGTVTITASVPANTTAHLVVPGLLDQALGSGKYTFTVRPK